MIGKMNVNNEISSFDRFKVSGHVVLRRIGEDVLLVPVSGPAAVAGGRVYPLNATAEAIWARLVAGDTISGIAEALGSRYDVPREQIEADVFDCVGTFLSEDLLERIDA